MNINNNEIFHYTYQVTPYYLVVIVVAAIDSSSHAGGDRLNPWRRNPKTTEIQLVCLTVSTHNHENLVCITELSIRREQIEIRGSPQ